MKWQTHAIIATYTTLQVDNVIIDWLFELHVKVVFLMLKTKPGMIFLSSIALTQSLLL
jgi:hypothetical protein